MRDSLGSDRFCEAVCAQWLAEATVVSRRLAAAPDTREDLAHEALLRVLEHPPARENAGAWIQRICRNLHVDAWRDLARLRRIGTDGPTSTPARSAEDLILARERRRVVRRALLALPRPQRRALILRFYGGWSFDRIATRLGMKEATTRTRVHRALAALRAQIATVRVWIAPGALALKPALVALIVVAASNAPSVAPRPVSISAAEARALPAANTRARFSYSRSARRSDGVELAQAAEGRHRARAESTPEPAPPHPAATPAVQRLDFEEDHVTGDLQRPDEEPNTSIVAARHPSLIELRRQFVPEIEKTFEDL